MGLKKHKAVCNNTSREICESCSRCFQHQSEVLRSDPNDKIKRCLEIINRNPPILSLIDKLAFVKKILEEE